MSPVLSQTANRIPVAPPSNPSKMLSVSHCLMSLPGPAPMASRTATSLRRLALRASSRLARLAQVTKRTMAVMRLDAGAEPLQLLLERLVVQNLRGGLGFGNADVRLAPGHDGQPAMTRALHAIGGNRPES